MKAISSKQLAEKLTDLLLDDSANEVLLVTSLMSFQDAGVMTINDGIVIRLPDGSEYQITVVKSR